MHNTENNKRIARNTAMLYFRMFLTMGVSLYTSRIVLNTLGVVDFGIYNVVGGVVVMFSFLNSSMASATQRFLSFELGKKNYRQLRKVFCMSINIHSIIAFFILLLAETIGLWFLNAKLNVPAERMEAANWVYQFTVLSFLVTVFSVPYNASIIAHERMDIYAYVSVIEVILKLFIVFALVWFGYDKLKMYAIFTFCVSAIIWVIYKVYCQRNYEETRYKFFWEKSLYKTLMNYAIWNLFANVAVVVSGQGINILLNLFFGPVVNAARGIAYQVNGAVHGFIKNFQTAMNPPIVKAYASNDMLYMHQLIFHGSKYSYFLLFMITLPLVLETEIILGWWLKIVPEYTVIFCRLVLINALIESISNPLKTAAQASGRIKRYMAVVGGLMLLIFPISYIFLKLGFLPQIALYVSISISIIALFARLYILRTLIQISVKKFLKEVVFIAIVISVIAIILPLIINIQMDQGFIRFFIVSVMSVCCTSVSIYFFGLNHAEKQFLQRRKLAIINKIKKFTGLG